MHVARSMARVPALYALDPFLTLQRLLCSPWLDGPMAVLSIACEGWAMALVALAFALGRERSAPAAARAVLPVLAGMVLAGLAVQLLKYAVNLPRPLSVHGSAVHVLLQPLRAHSFPSGHAATAAALALAAIRRWRRAAWPLVLLAFAGGLSRVYVGAHWTVDVVAGWAVGASAAWVAGELTARGAARLARARGRATAGLPARDPAVAE